ncbi:hypothetical protein Patl1_24594 [Pistacia atlantica]|uniref:Uncharacterized protein n=1 Tax=Pistacia atlantica TaxID=434234 RepID=A0ACC0ZZC0_9ROSI|nr:hypothetical protein Patl1_24594 [Pistacia atlantica]
MDISQRIKFQTTNLSQLHNCEQTPKKWRSLSEQTRISLTELGRSLKSSLRRKTSSSQRGTVKDDDEALVSDVEIAQQWAASERLPTFGWLKASLLDKEGEGRVGVELPTIEVRYKSFIVEADCEIGHGKPLSTLRSSLKRSLLVLTKLIGSTSNQAKITIINDINGIVKTGR